MGTKEGMPEEPAADGIRFGLPRPYTNSQLNFTIVPEFPPDYLRAATTRPPEGSPGTYRVTFVLVAPGRQTFSDAYNEEEWLGSGESLLYVHPGTQVHLDMENYPDVAELWVHSNDQGALSRAEVQVHADSFWAAERKAHDALAFVLSWWSYKYSVAIDINGYRVELEGADVYKRVFNALGRPKPFDVEDAIFSTPKFRRVLAAYREAMNASNAFYQVICFQKVLAGLYKVRRERLAKEKASVGTGREPGERIEDRLEAVQLGDDPHRDLFEPYLGKKFTTVRDDLRSVLRNAVAHLDPNGNSLVADELKDLQECRNAAPVLKYMCDVMLGNEIRADPEHQPYLVT